MYPNQSHDMITRTNTYTVEQCPEGYPRLAAFIDSDENFMLYRRFGFLQTRLLLNKQDELRELEKDLDRLDKYDEMNNPGILRSRERDWAEKGKRKALLQDIAKTFKEYCNSTSDLQTQRLIFCR